MVCFSPEGFGGVADVSSVSPFLGYFSRQSMLQGIRTLSWLFVCCKTCRNTWRVLIVPGTDEIVKHVDNPIPPWWEGGGGDF